MTGFRLTAAALTAAAVLLSLPVAAQAGEYFIPEGNAAVTQYSESYPSAGGEKGGHGKQATAGDTIGAKHAKKLAAAGPEGAAAAQVAVETAPVATTPPPSPAPAPSHPQSGTSTGSTQHRNTAPGKPDTTSGVGHTAAPAQAESTAPGSAAGEVAAKALGGGSPGQLGILLPLVLLATLAGAIAYRLKRHGEPAG